MISRLASIAVLLLASTTPALATDRQDDIAERHLRACLVSGSAGAPRTSLAAAISAVRVLCSPQIHKLSDIRVHNATSGLSDTNADDFAKRTRRTLNDEIAVTIGRLTGLTG